MESFSYILRKADSEQSTALYTTLLSSLADPPGLYASLVLDSLKAY